MSEEVVETIMHYTRKLLNKGEDSQFKALRTLYKIDGPFEHFKESFEFAKVHREADGKLGKYAKKLHKKYERYFGKQKEPEVEVEVNIVPEPEPELVQKKEAEEPKPNQHSSLQFEIPRHKGSHQYWAPKAKNQVDQVETNVNSQKAEAKSPLDLVVSFEKFKSDHVGEDLYALFKTTLAVQSRKHLDEFLTHFPEYTGDADEHYEKFVRSEFPHRLADAPAIGSWRRAYHQFENEGKQQKKELAKLGAAREKRLTDSISEKIQAKRAGQKKAIMIEVPASHKIMPEQNRWAKKNQGKKPSSAEHKPAAGSSGPVCNTPKASTSSKASTTNKGSFAAATRMPDSGTAGPIRNTPKASAAKKGPIAPMMAKCLRMAGRKSK